MTSIKTSLVTKYQGYALTLARMLYNRLPKLVYFNMEDFEQEAIIGLIDAVNRYDETRGIAFKTYASQRIIGAVKDRIRYLSDRKRHEVHGTKQVLYTNSTVHLSTIEDSGILDRVFGSYEINIDDKLDGEKLRERLLNIVGTLPRRQMECCKLYFFEGLSMHDVGHVLGLAESTVSSHVNRAVRRLRKIGLREGKEAFINMGIVATAKKEPIPLNLKGVWLHTVRRYEVMVVAVLGTNVVKYRRVKPVFKGGTPRVATMARKRFLRTFYPKAESEPIPTETTTTNKTEVSDKTSFLDTLPSVKEVSKLPELKTLITTRTLDEFLNIARAGTPFTLEETKSLFDVVESLDSVIRHIYELVTTKSWLLLSQPSSRKAAVSEYLATIKGKEVAPKE